MNRPCVQCGELTPTSPCNECRAEVERARHEHHDRGTFAERGYDAVWTKLSKRARRIQPWCTDCGSQERLQLDHLPSAWDRKARRKPIRLALDAQVVCNDCNAARGSSRPGTPRYAAWQTSQTRGRDPKRDDDSRRGWARNASHTGDVSAVTQ